ncbi:MAG: TolC family protein, partial [Treponemataceae bacterium]|nr:TolC family protein [Treponemataceae bacterium]
LEDLRSALTVNNPDIRSAQQEYQRALLDVKDAKASKGPSIDLQFSGTVMAKPLIEPIYINTDAIIDAIQWPAGTRPQTNGQYVKVFDGVEQTMYQLQATLTQPLFTWGKLDAAQNLYEAVAEIRKTSVGNTTRQLETELETRLVSLGYLFAMQDILTEEQGYAEQLVHYSEDGERSGMLLHQDVVDARIQAKQLDIAVQTLEEQIENQLLELRRTTGIADLSRSTLLLPSSEHCVAEVLAADRAVWGEQALSPESDSMMMVHRLKEVSDLAAGIAENSLYWKPDMALQVSAGYGGSRIPLLEPNWLRKDDYTLNISVGMKTTVWDGGKKLNALARSVSEAESSQITVDATEATIRQTLSTQWNTLDMAIIKAEYQDIKIDGVQSKIAQQEKLFSSGYGSEADLLSARIELCNERLEKQQQLLTRDAACYTIRFLCR